MSKNLQPAQDAFHDKRILCVESRTSSAWEWLLTQIINSIGASLTYESEETFLSGPYRDVARYREEFAFAGAIIHLVSGSLFTKHLRVVQEIQQAGIPVVATINGSTMTEEQQQLLLDSNVSFVDKRDTATFIDDALLSLAKQSEHR